MRVIHPSAECNRAQFGVDVAVGPMAVLAPGVEVGERATVGAHAGLEEGVRVGAGAIVGGGARLSRGARVEAGARVGENAVVAPGVVIGQHSVVEPCAYVIGDVPPKAVVRGNPALIVSYVHAAPEPTSLIEASTLHEPVEVAAGCMIWPLPRFRDLRGSLIAAEHGNDLPFVPSRTFIVYDVPSAEVRGEHAHRECAQFLIAVHGALSVVVDDGQSSSEVRLWEPDRGLLVPPRVWGVQYRFTSDAVLCVFASHPYDPADYIRDYEGFLALVSSHHASMTSSG